MNSKSILELKNIFATREQLTIGQQLNIKGGDDKRREDIASKTTTTTTTMATATVAKTGN
jgi:hypothetical protein